MKIANYEVEILSKDKVKVGCQEVSREDVLNLLTEMDSFVERGIPFTGNATFLAYLIVGSKEPYCNGSVIFRTDKEVAYIEAKGSTHAYNPIEYATKSRVEPFTGTLEFVDGKCVRQTIKGENK